MASNRIGRINEEIQRELSDLIRSLKDPRVQTLLSITRVDTTPDLRYSKIYISVLDEEKQKDALRGLKSAGGWLRRELGSSLQLRYTPELVFELDDSLKYGAHMFDLLSKLEAEQKERQAMTRLETAQMLREHDNFIILTHRRPDGDTTGCAAGLCLGLRALGKSAWVLRNRQLTPKLAPFAEGLLTDTCPEDATVISVDIASLGLFSFDAEALHLEERLCFAIDHHGSNDLSVPKLVEPDSAACGEIILELLELLGVTLTRQMAEALYLAISTDTGCFKYSNTTAHTHAAAATLIAAGAEVYPINKAFFDTKSFARLKLEARLTDSIELYGGGIVGLCTMPKSLLTELQISEDDVDSISGFARSIEGVEIGIMIREVEDGGGKISLRTSEHYNASELCKALGGGGHAAAAGATVPGGITGARHAILSLLAQRGIIRER